MTGNKAETLADFLGVETSAPPLSEEPRLEDITDAKSFALAVLESREFRCYIINSLVLGSLPAAIACRMMDYAWGKPVEHVQIEDKIQKPEDLTAEQLEARAMRLAAMARSIRLAPISDGGEAEQKTIH